MFLMNGVVVEVLRGNENLTRLNEGRLGLRFYPEDERKVTLAPGEIMDIQTGLKALPPFGCVAGITSRKIFEGKKLLCLFGSLCIDTGFPEELVLPFQNLSNTEQALDVGDEIAEIFFMKVSEPHLHIKASESLEE